MTGRLLFGLGMKTLTFINGMGHLKPGIDRANFNPFQNSGPRGNTRENSAVKCNKDLF